MFKVMNYLLNLVEYRLSGNLILVSEDITNTGNTEIPKALQNYENRGEGTFKTAEQ
jgi:hypothetical protein